MKATAFSEGKKIGGRGGRKGRGGGGKGGKIGKREERCATSALAGHTHAATSKQPSFLEGKKKKTTRK